MNTFIIIVAICLAFLWQRDFLLKLVDSRAYGLPHFRPYYPCHHCGEVLCGGFLLKILWHLYTIYFGIFTSFAGFSVFTISAEIATSRFVFPCTPAGYGRRARLGWWGKDFKRFVEQISKEFVWKILKEFVCQILKEFVCEILKEFVWNFLKEFVWNFLKENKGSFWKGARKYFKFS